jgi:hypothetical protein
MNQWTAAATLGQGNDPHTQVVGTYFTGVPVTPHTSDPFSFQAATKFEAMPTAPSLDHVCARQVNESRVPLFMRVGGRIDPAQSAISYSAGETIYGGIGTAAEALSLLTGLFNRGDPLSPDSYQVARGRSVLDVVRSDLETLERYDMSSADREKLAAWKALLNETSTVASSAQCNPEVSEALGLNDANFLEAQASNDISFKLTGGLDGADLYSNLAVLSALCDQSRVTFLKYPPNYVFEALGLTTETHSLSHRIQGVGVGCVRGTVDLIQTVDKYYAEKFAHLVQKLDSFEEAGGTLLDNTAAVWFQELSDGNAHNLNNMPIIQAGGCGGYFKTGQAVNVDDGSSDLHQGYSSYGCEVEFPADITETGTPESYGNAPINKYFCNLMNAIGIKADDSGFAAEGGNQEVTHFGMYDDTTLFASGGTEPPSIVDPGAFEELKA